MRYFKRFAATAALAGLLCLRSASAGIDSADAAEILNTLLDLENPAFVATDGKGKKRYDSLKAYQGWEALYGKYFGRANAGVVEQEDLRVFLLLGKIAGETTDAATMQAFTSDLMQVYETRPKEVLQVLKALPYLVPSTCHYLNRYFGFEDKHRDRKPEFLEANEGLIRSLLPTANAEMCLGYFRAP